jgi:[acyl-carrier-protein] S-malonyltransferase
MNSREVAWLFPGQGSQSVGMGWDLCHRVPVAAGMLEIAESICGTPLKEVCWRGPEELLRRTEILQPALTAISLGCVAMLKGVGLHAGRGRGA